MRQLVTIYNNNALITDSLTVAEVFGKRHDNVLKDIKNLGCSLDFSLLNFKEAPYVHEQNKQTYRKYLITQDGFTLLAMGYNGSEAMKFKEMYINEFNRMKNELAKMNKPKLPQTYKEALIALVEAEEVKERLALENQQKQQLIETQEPMVDSFKKWLDADGCMNMGTFAKMIGMGRNTLFKILKEKPFEIIMSNNQPYQRYMKYFRVVDVVKETKNGNRTFQATLLNHDGCQYIKEKLKRAELI